jgi:valyl-tRNA synthetase
MVSVGLPLAPLPLVTSILSVAPGQDTKLSEAKIEGFRNFTNKLWNISRFILMQMNEEGVVQSTDATLADQWILACLETVKASVTKKLESYQFSVAGEELRDFTWNDLADWYLEIAKVEKGKKVILERVLRTVLSLWHPFMPFVTEAIWQEAKFGDWLIVSEWPTSVEQGAGPTPALPFAGEGVGAEGQFDQLRQLVSDMRRLRADSGVEPAKKIVFSLVTQPELQAVIAVNIEWMKRLTQASDIVFVDALPSSFAVTQSGVNVIGIDLSGTIDVAKERQKAEKELAQLVNYIQSTSAKLTQEDFVSKAPTHVIDQMKAKLLEAQEKQAILEQRLTQLSNV